MHGYRCSEELKVIQFHFENIEYPYKNQSRAKEINKISKVRYLQSSKNEQLQLTRFPDENPKKKKKITHDRGLNATLGQNRDVFGPILARDARKEKGAKGTGGGEGDRRG